MKKLKEKRSLLIITSLMMLLPMLAGIILWDKLPDTIAVHFGADNQPNGWSSKAFAVFGIPSIMLALHLICAFATAADPKTQNVSDKMFTLVLWIIPVICIVCMSLIYISGLGITVDAGFAIMLVLGVLFTIIGNLLPKCKQSYTVGIKTPWTLADEETWRATHRLAGILWTACGMLCVIMTLVGLYHIIVPIFIVMAFVPMIYSYFHYKKRNG